MTRIKNLIRINLSISLLATALLSSVNTLYDFTNKEFQDPVKVKIFGTPAADIRLSARTLGGHDEPSASNDAGYHIFSGTYFTEVAISGRNSPEETSIEIITPTQTLIIENRSLHTDVTLTTQDVFAENRSRLPIVNKVINWKGDWKFLTTFLAYLLKYALLSLLYTSIFSALILLLHQNSRGSHTRLFRGNLFGKDMLAMCLAISFGVAIYGGIVFFRNDFDIGIFSVYLANRMVMDSILFIAITSLIYLISRSRVLVAVSGVLYVLFIMQDALIYYFGNTVFEKSHLDLIAPYSLLGFSSFESICLAAVFLLLATVLARLSYTVCTKTRWSFVLTAFVLWLGLVYMNVAGFASLALEAVTFSSVERFSTKLQSDQIAYSMQNSLINFVDEIVGSVVVRPDYITDLSDYRSLIEKYDLTLGERHYPKVGTTEFRKIILVTTESLSLDLLSAHNEHISINNSPFYGGNPIRNRTYTNYRTAAHNTLQGLVVTFNSHPNYALLTETGRRYYESALPKLLHENGYQTYFIRSASKYYANENIYFREMGFENILGKEHFENRFPNLVEGWGAFDRLIYDEAIQILKRSGDDKIFVTLLGVDTHPPVGRANFGKVDYENQPFSIHQELSLAEKYLRAFWYHDYEIGRFIRSLKEQNLFTEDVLIVLTADHASPYNNVVAEIPGYPDTSLARIPLIFLSEAKLPPQNYGQLSSQLDLAPSILHLLGLDIPFGYWGQSLFLPSRVPAYIGYDRGNYYVETEDRRRVIRASAPADHEQKAFIGLANSLFAK